jgi:SPP1 gp7 family putative phage head morphogenesis protein
LSAYQEFEKILFSFAVEAAVAGGQKACQQVEYGHNFHFEDADSLRYLEANAIKLAESSSSRLKKNLEEVIRAGLKDGKPTAEVTKEVHAIFENFTGYEAERIARTEIARGVNTGAITGYKEMGIKVAEVYANAGACPICQMLSGELWTVDKALQVLPRHPNCYCFWLPRPDISEPGKIPGGRGLGEIAREVVEGLGVKLGSNRVSMTKTHVRHSGHHNHLSLEEAGTTVASATGGFIDSDDAICLVMDMGDEQWFIPVKRTNDVGLLGLSGYKLTKTELRKKLERAKESYGL